MCEWVTGLDTPQTVMTIRAPSHYILILKGERDKQIFAFDYADINYSNAYTMQD